MAENETERNNKQTMNAPRFIIGLFGRNFNDQIAIGDKFLKRLCTHRQNSVCPQAKNLAYFAVVNFFLLLIVSCRLLMLLVVVVLWLLVHSPMHNYNTCFCAIFFFASFNTAFGLCRECNDYAIVYCKWPTHWMWCGCWWQYRHPASPHFPVSHVVLYNKIYIWGSAYTNSMYKYNIILCALYALLIRIRLVYCTEERASSMNADGMLSNCISTNQQQPTPTAPSVTAK